jgi:hypothetical protein
VLCLFLHGAWNWIVHCWLWTMMMDNKGNRDNTFVEPRTYILFPPFRNIRCFSFVKWVYLDIF